MFGLAPDTGKTGLDFLLHAFDKLATRVDQRLLCLDPGVDGSLGFDGRVEQLRHQDGMNLETSTRFLAAFR